jgi:hypothetical protein
LAMMAFSAPTEKIVALAVGFLWLPAGDEG